MSSLAGEEISKCSGAIQRRVRWLLALVGFGLVLVLVGPLAGSRRGPPTLSVAKVGYTNTIHGARHAVFKVHNGTRRSMLRRSSIAVQFQLDERGSFENRPYTNLPTAVLQPGQHELISLVPPATEHPWRVNVALQRHHPALIRPVARLAEVLNDVPLLGRWDEALNGGVDFQSEWIAPEPDDMRRRLTE